MGLTALGCDIEAGFGLELWNIDDSGYYYRLFQLRTVTWALRDIFDSSCDAILEYLCSLINFDF